MSLLYLKIDLAQNTVYTTHPDYTQAQNTYIIGEINNKFDTSNVIFLTRKPDNNVIKVSIFDKATNLINTENFNYVIQLFLEKVED